MNELAALLWAVPLGAAAGLINYGGLWLTVRALPRSRHPALLMLLSLLGRLGLVALVVYLMTRGPLSAFVPLLAAFVAVRAVLVKRLRPQQPAADVSEAVS